ncbi:hypothetical protein [Sodalis sp. RH20]|uniref:hypothetical protein n=1 Tax=unclassified Sodalis (in: enterobacteria) TaxID=2636512 RepID=UPI0039B54420
MVNMDTVYINHHPPALADGFLHLRGSHCLDRLKNSLKEIVNSVISMANSFYYISQIAFAAEHLCERMYFRKMSTLMKYVGNVTHFCANGGLFMQKMPAIGGFALNATEHYPGHGPRNQDMPLVGMIKFITHSHLPDLINRIVNPEHEKAFCVPLSMAELVSKSTHDIINLVEKEKNDYEKGLFFLKALQKSVAFFIQVKNLIDNIVAAFKFLSGKINTAIERAVLTIKDLIINPFFDALKNMTQKIFLLLSHLFMQPSRQ